MVDITTRLLPRDVLASFLPDPRSIRAFEDLQQDVVDSGDVTTAIQTAGLLTAVAAPAALTGARQLLAGAGLAATDGGPGAGLTVRMQNTGVAAGTYGTAAGWPALTIDALGRVTAAAAPAAPIAALPAGGTAGQVLSKLSGANFDTGWGAVNLATQVTGVLPPANGGTGTGAFTAGSIVFAGASGVYAQNNALLFWDNVNQRLGVGTNTPLTGAIGNAASITAGVFKTVAGSVASIHATAITIATIPSGTNCTYIVSCALSANDPVNYSAVSIVSMDFATLRATALQTAALLTISVSGADIRATQFSGLPQTIFFTVTRVS